MSGPVKFGEKSQIVNPAGNHPYHFLERSNHVQQDIRLVGLIVGLLDRYVALTHRDTPKTEKFCMSRPVKFGEKSQILKPAGNNPYHFLERSYHVKQDIRLVGLIVGLLDR